VEVAKSPTRSNTISRLHDFTLHAWNCHAEAATDATGARSAGIIRTGPVASRTSRWLRSPTNLPFARAADILSRSPRTAASAILVSTSFIGAARRRVPTRSLPATASWRRTRLRSGRPEAGLVSSGQAEPCATRRRPRRRPSQGAVCGGPATRRRSGRRNSGRCRSRIGYR